jgi:hypothetical protein
MAAIGWEWLAGFFEGEGCIAWYEGDGKRGRGARLMIGQVDKRPLQAIYDFLLQEGITSIQFYLRPASASYRSTPCWMLSVTKRDDVLRYLDGIRPWLFQKAEKADMVKERLLQGIAERDDTLAKALTLKTEGQSWREISNILHIGRTALTNYATSKGIDLSRQPGFENEVEWRKDRIARGLCSKCGKPRGELATKWMCRPCADRFNLYQGVRKSKIRIAELEAQIAKEKEVEALIP